MAVVSISVFAAADLREAISQRHSFIKAISVRLFFLSRRDVLFALVGGCP